jgi:multiple sugar transport system permease protein
MAVAPAKPTESTSSGFEKPVKLQTRRQRMLMNSLKAYAFIAPAMIILFVFHFFPIIYAFILSLYQRLSALSSIVPPSSQFAGFANYGNLFADGDFWNSLGNTLYYTVGVVIIGLSAALLLALLIHNVKKGKGFYRVMFFIPYVTSLVAVATVWYLIFAPFSSNALTRANPDRPGGLMNYVFASLNIPMQRWLIDDRGIFTILFDNGGNPNYLLIGFWLILSVGLFLASGQATRRINSSVGIVFGSVLAAVGTITAWAFIVEFAHIFRWSGLGGPSMAMLCVIIIAVWHSLGFNIVIITAGLTNISKELYEAAKIDGARGWAMLSKMTIPLLSPTLYFLLITTTISAFQAFTLFYALFPGRPSKSVEVLSIFYYDIAFQRGSGSPTSGFGYASTVVVIMLLTIVVINQLQQRLLAKRVNYD